MLVTLRRVGPLTFPTEIAVSAQDQLVGIEVLAGAPYLLVLGPVGAAADQSRLLIACTVNRTIEFPEDVVEMQVVGRFALHGMMETVVCRAVRKGDLFGYSISDVYETPETRPVPDALLAADFAVDKGTLRSQVLAHLAEYHWRSFTPAVLAPILSAKEKTLRGLLPRMVKADEIARPAYGAYQALPPFPYKPAFPQTKEEESDAPIPPSRAHAGV